MKDSIGVLITYYNEKELLGECLESIYRQTIKPEEVIIYDDASRYPAGDYVPHGLPVRIIRSELNRGPAWGRNELLRISKSDYIHFHDADDLFHPEWCKNVQESLKITRRDVILTEISSYSEGRLLSESILGLKYIKPGEDMVRLCLRGAMLTPAGTYRREVVLNIGGFRNELWQSEDFDFSIRLAASGVSYAIIDSPLIFQTIRPLSRSQDRKAVWSSAVKAVYLLSKELPQKYHVDLSEAAARFGSSLFQLRAYREARDAFDISVALGHAKYLHKRTLYRTIAKIIGPYLTEQSSMFYRKLVPKFIRSFITQKGW